VIEKIHIFAFTIINYSQLKFIVMKGFLCFMFLAMIMVFTNQQTTANEKSQANHQICTDMGVPCVTPVMNLAINNFETAEKPKGYYLVQTMQIPDVFILLDAELQNQYFLAPPLQKQKNRQIRCNYDPGWNYMI
jgi:hypothetical protein